MNPIARSATLSTKCRIPSCGTTQFITSSTASLTSRSQPDLDQPGDRSKTTVLTFVESTPTLNKAHACRRSLLIFGMLSAISVLSPLLATDFLCSSTLNPFVPVAEAIVVPRSVLDGLLTALHIKLNHPSHHQFQRQFFALDMTDVISRVTSACHACASLKSFPSSLVKQSSDDPPEVVGASFAADVIKRHRQLILVFREYTMSFTASCLVHDEKHDALRDALTQLIVGLYPLDGPRAIIHVDPSPGFQSMANNDTLNHLNVTIEVGRVKNKHKNPVAEKAVRELEEELIRQEPGGRSVSAVGLALATARLNSRLRLPGLSSRELWTQRNQFIHEQLPLSDYNLILGKHEQRSTNHAFSEKSKNPRGLVPNTPSLHAGDIVYLISDKDKSRARDRYIVVSFDPPWCFVKKLTGSQLRATSYKIKLSECYAVPPSVLVSDHYVPKSLKTRMTSLLR